MADERENAGQQVRVLNKYAWSRLVKLDGDDLELQYRHTLENLGKQRGMLGTIFPKAQNNVDADHPRPAPKGCLRSLNSLPANLSGPRQAGKLDQDNRQGAVVHLARGCERRHL